MKYKFATSINCMDGRVQIPVIEYMKHKFKVKYVDMITEPGPNKILCENCDECLINSIKSRVDISVNNHGSKVISVVGHYDCAGNPVDKEKQIEDIKCAVDNVKNWCEDIEVIGLYVDDKWKVKKIC